jgi:hypothetical protein
MFVTFHRTRDGRTDSRTAVYKRISIRSNFLFLETYRNTFLGLNFPQLRKRWDHIQVTFTEDGNVLTEDILLSDRRTWEDEDAKRRETQKARLGY